MKFWQKGFKHRASRFQFRFRASPAPLKLIHTLPDTARPDGIGGAFRDRGEGTPLMGFIQPALAAQPVHKMRDEAPMFPIP